MLELLCDNRVALEIASSTSVAGFDAQIAVTRSLLEKETAELAVSRFEVSGNELLVDVLLTNRTGHKLPTAYPSRRMWLHLTVRDAANQVVFESGAPDANGHISTDAGRLVTDFKQMVAQLPPTVEVLATVSAPRSGSRALPWLPLLLDAEN